MAGAFPKPFPRCGVLLAQWNASCPSCGVPIPLPLGPLGRRTLALEPRRRAVRLLSLLCLVLFALGGLPILAVAEQFRRDMPLFVLVNYLPELVLLAIAGVGIGAGLVWALIDCKCVQLPTLKPDSR